MICERTANPVNPEGPRLGAGQMPEPDHRALIDKARHVEAELGDRPCNLRDLSFGMRAGVRNIGEEPVDRPTLDAIRQPGRHDRGKSDCLGW